MNLYSFYILAERYLLLFLVVAFEGIILISCNSDQEHRGEKGNLISPVTKSGLFAGREACKECHPAEYRLFLGSDHDMAMDVASDSIVLGDFDNAAISVHGVQSIFYRDGKKFMVKTEGEDGEIQDFEIKYTFGFEPLQQYLIEFPGGRVQCLPLCWDTRPEEEGGQKWFHVYGDEEIAHDDILFWTRISQNWNYMCAECHSTNLEKRYDAGKGIYNTSWSEIDVSCEACHGPGSEHIRWARLKEDGGHFEGIPDMGLDIRFNDLTGGTWVFRDLKSGNAVRSVARDPRPMADACGRCHARRGIIDETYEFNRSFLQTHRPSLLEEHLYFADGQIRDEVYVYASFMQSKMYMKGVVCTDCHDPHSTRVYSDDNALCYRCHLAEKYGSKEHHFHKEGTPAALCTDCHMPERTYMVIDPRRDHSIRIPRPDLTIRLGVPNACNQCHADKTPEWADHWYRKWYGDPGRNGTHYGEVFWAARRSYPEAIPALKSIIASDTLGPVIRATAILLLANYNDPSLASVIAGAALETDPLLRYAAVSAMPAMMRDQRAELLAALLGDTVRYIRSEAARQLAALPEDFRENVDEGLFEIALNEYRDSQMINADHPTAWFNLALLDLYNNDLASAEQKYLKSIRMEPMLATGYINLADLYRLMGREEEGRDVLSEAIERNPDGPDAYFAMGLNLVRQKERQEGLGYLKKAAELDPENVYYLTTYAIGVNSEQSPEAAVSYLETVISRHPYDKDVLYLLAVYNNNAGHQQKALDYAEKLVEYYPEDPSQVELRDYIKSLND